MSYENDCDVEVVNYFSNPDVLYNNMRTGTDTHDNARAAEENMVSAPQGQHYYMWSPTMAMVANRVLIVLPRVFQFRTSH